MSPALVFAANSRSRYTAAFTKARRELEKMRRRYDKKEVAQKIYP
jgi:hypothetical protein